MSEEMTITEKQAQQALEKNYGEAEKLLKDHDRLSEFLDKLESKLNEIPKIGKKLANVPVLVAMVRSYLKKEYTALPIGTMISVVGALLYFLSPVDLIPDVIPLAGLLDDAAVIAVCCKLIATDLELYKEWRKNQIEA